ncbi:hypothetical protein CPB84DRAFT_1795506 [Gymnopilus junonius]|uniref:F-box domain-containing protein n=1 Tax=Gymnopilus junonius TaxID=109634 RepID=A0A9P5TH40_GYMJU|nr:hypothetical protein CPB84DRAFT_1795506 [Gymnopilus junonius]
MPSLDIRLPVVSKVATRAKLALNTEEISRRRTYNQQLPIFQLCPDILEYLFLLATELEYPYRLRRAIIAWSHTCHYWRVVAHSVKALWAMLIDFDDRSCRWNEEMLRLSNPLPVELSYRGDLSRDTQTLALQILHLSRIQRYSVTCRDTDWANLLPYHLPSFFRPIRPPSPLIPPSLFAGHAPNLRRLVMNECMIDFRSPLLASLVHLKVTNLSYDHALSAIEWLDHLCQMPSLVELVLENAILPSRYHPQSTNLVLDAPASEISALLQHLPMPKSRNWTVTCLDSRPGSDVEAILQTFSDGISDADSVYTHSPLLIAANEYDIYLRYGLVTEERSSKSYLSFTFHTTAYQFWDSLFPSVAAGLGDAILNVTSLELILPAVLPSLLSLLRRAARLSTLARLSAKVSKTLLPELQTSSSMGLERFGVFLPRLDSIVFTDDKSMWGESYRSFIAFLKWRKEVSAPIRTVYFSGCCILESVIKEITTLGVEVEGDMDGFRWQNF